MRGISRADVSGDVIAYERLSRNGINYLQACVYVSAYRSIACMLPRELDSLY